MAHEATLKIVGTKYDIVECEYEFNQAINKNGQPAGIPNVTEIRFVVQTPDNEDLSLHDWMRSETRTFDGEATFSVINQGKFSTRVMRFYAAHCIRLREHIRAQDEQMLTEITLNVRAISFGKEDEVVFGDAALTMKS